MKPIAGEPSIRVALKAQAIGERSFDEDETPMPTKLRKKDKRRGEKAQLGIGVEKGFSRRFGAERFAAR